MAAWAKLQQGGSRYYSAAVASTSGRFSSSLNPQAQKRTPPVRGVLYVMIEDERGWLLLRRLFLALERHEFVLADLAVLVGVGVRPLGEKLRLRRRFRF